MTPFRRLRGDDAGAVIVEFALVLIILIPLGMGIAEFGLAYRDALTLDQATHSAVRIADASNETGGKHAGTDRYALEGAMAAMGKLNMTKIDRVIIYDASSSSGGPPAACITAGTTSPGYGPSSGTDHCNVYTGAFLNGLATGSVTWSSTYESHWAPAGRDVDGTDGSTGFVGVYIKYNHDYMTKFWGKTVTMTDRTVGRLDPCVDLGGPTC